MSNSSVQHSSGPQVSISVTNFGKAGTAEDRGGHCADKARRHGRTAVWVSPAPPHAHNGDVQMCWGEYSGVPPKHFQIFQGPNL